MTEVADWVGADREADYRRLSPLRPETSELKGEEVYSVLCRLVSRNLRDRRQNNICFPQICVVRTKIKLVSRLICYRRFEYLGGKGYVASDWTKNDEKKVKYSEKKIFFFTVTQLFT
jgi:hypothetical protein